MEAVQELVDVISMKDFLHKESRNLGKLPPANLLEKPADLWNFFEVGVPVYNGTEVPLLGLLLHFPTPFLSTAISFPPPTANAAAFLWKPGRRGAELDVAGVESVRGGFGFPNGAGQATTA